MFEPADHTGPNDNGYEVIIRYNNHNKRYYVFKNLITGGRRVMDLKNEPVSFESMKEVIKHLA